MSWRILWEAAALNAAAGYLKDDPEGVDALLQATDQLAENARPAESRPWGTEHWRLRRGPWRVLYRLDLDGRIVHIEHIGHTGSG